MQVYAVFITELEELEGTSGDPLAQPLLLRQVPKRFSEVTLVQMCMFGI